MMKGYKHVNKKTQIDPANILRRKTLTINRFFSGSDLLFFDSDQFMANLSLFREFDHGQFNQF